MIEGAGRPVTFDVACALRTGATDVEPQRAFLQDRVASGRAG